MENLNRSANERSPFRTFCLLGSLGSTWLCAPTLVSSQMWPLDSRAWGKGSVLTSNKEGKGRKSTDDRT